MTIRVVVADDERLIRAGYRMILDTEPDLEVVGEAEDGVVAVELARRLAPDVVLMDVRMPRMDGIAATRALSRWAPAPAVLVVTTFDLDEYVYESLRAVARLQRRDSAGRLRLCRGVQPDRGGAEVAPDGRGRHPHRTAGVRPGEAGLWEGAPQAERITARER